MPNPCETLIVPLCLMNITPESRAPDVGGATPVLVAVYWLVVAVPLGWGVFQTVEKSIPLFHVTNAPVVTPAGEPATPLK